MARVAAIPAGSRKRIACVTCVFLLTMLVAFVFARHLLGTQFNDYDDEGYVLLSVKHYLSGEQLYTRVFSQYGPFYYLVADALLRVFHMPVTNDAGRLLTLLFWMLSAAACTYFAYRLSRNGLLAGAAGIVGTGLGRVLANEPSHPQMLVLPMLVLAGCVALTPTPAAMAVLAALGVALLLTKVNVGVFYLAALFGALACGLPKGTARKTAIALCGAYMLLMPPVLMHRDFRTWAGGYCVAAVVCGLAALVAGVATSPEIERPWRAWMDAVAGGVVTTVVIVGAAAMHGLSVSTLIRGVFLDPLKHNGRLELPAPVSAVNAFIAVLIIVAMVWLYRLRSRPESYAKVLGSLQFVFGICGAFLLFHPFDLVHPWLMGALPLAVMPPPNGRWRTAEYFPRLFVTLLSVTQFLQPYPVAGSQGSIAAAPLLLWSFVCLYDGIQGGVGEMVERRFAFLPRRISMLSVVAAVIFVPLALRLVTWHGVWRGFAAPPSSLRGSQSLHLPASQEDVYVPLASEIHANCDMLFTMPGMGSFNFWSGVPTPNGLNQTHWINEFTPEEQEPILAILRESPRACVLYNPRLVGNWLLTQSEVNASPLAQYILTDMPIVYKRQDYQIRVSPLRRSPWTETDPSLQP